MRDLTLIFPFILTLLAAAAAGAVAVRQRSAPATRRFANERLAWLLAAAPAAAFLYFASLYPRLSDGSALTLTVEWLPSLGLSAGLYVDGLSLLFALLVTGIGTLVVIYAGYYFGDDPTAPRFLAFIFLFMTAMVGIVTAGDLITLFVFWEGTSVTSFLLVAHKYKYAAARQGAFKALFITGGGGVALLAGFLLIGYASGSYAISELLLSGDVLRASSLYPVILGLVAFGAFTKSAQFPAHIWLPGAMSAPTPASAYLHSATMVKAGIYLMARLNPALGETEAWFWLLSIVGTLTMLTGAYLGLKQNDLKALLAYSTISQLGVLMLLIGQDTEIAFKALVVGTVAHALYKSALFLVAGTIDVQTGTRDLRQLGGLRRTMPFTFLITVAAALSMAGLPPLFGFLAKETLLATAVHPSLPASLAWVLPAASVAAGALLLAQSGLLLLELFFSPRQIEAREASYGMLLAPVIPAGLGLALGLLPEPEFAARLLANAAAAAYGDKVKVSLALWTGLNVPLFLSAVAIGIGSVLIWQRHQARALQNRIDERWTLNALHDGVMAGLDRLAYLATRLQTGRLRDYLAVMFLTTFGLVAFWERVALPIGLPELTLPTFDSAGTFVVLRIFALLVTAGAALASVVLRRDFIAIVAFGASGLGIAILMVLESAPDVALVQIVVDILSVVILVLALTRLPVRQRRDAEEINRRESRRALWRDGLVAGAIGLVVAAVTLIALTSRPRASAVTPYYIENAFPLTGAEDIVGAIIIDFRALDTLLEITVFGVAGLGIYSLLRYAARRDESTNRVPSRLRAQSSSWTSRGIGGRRTSAFVRVITWASLPVALLIAATHMMYGHLQPGDGFTAGVIISLGVGEWYVAYGYDETRRRLPWLRSLPLLTGGIILALATGIGAALVEGHFLAPVDIGKMLGLTLPTGFKLSTGFLFEVAIGLAVLGSTTYMINTLGHPLLQPDESAVAASDPALDSTAGQPLPSQGD